jgi:hypothetical protein
VKEVTANPHREAAYGYAGLGGLVILITLVAGLVPESRANPAIELGIGLGFIVLFAILIARGWWLLSGVLVFSNAWRAFTYFNDGRGVHVELLNRVVTPIEPQPVAFVNAALMVVIVGLLARSAWAGLSSWRARRAA